VFLKRAACGPAGYFTVVWRDKMNLQYLSLDKEFLFRWHEDLIAKSISHLEGKKLTNGKIEFYNQEFLKQYYTHFASIKALRPGLKIIYKGKENEITASASILVLIRACLENYSMFYYIYRHANCSEEIYFRFWSWFREGLMSRQRFVLPHMTDKQKDEKSQIDELTKELKQHSPFLSFTQRQQKQFLEEGKWYFSGKRQLLELSGFSKELALNCYNFFSSYTHPTSSSILQTSQADFNESNQITDSMTNALFIATGLYLYNYSETFDEIKKLYNDKDKEFMLTWCEFGKELLK
jgi:hypothetical protein